MIRAAQRALAQQNYYRGTVDGQLTYATQRALFEYQTDKNLTATGNLDWRTAQSLGLAGIVPNTGTVGGTMLSVTEASTVRRNAQSVAARQRQDLTVAPSGRLSNSMFGDADVDLWFALSAFADNASLYEQLVRSSSSNDAMLMGGRALINAARRVDTALAASRASNSVRNSWNTIRNQLRTLDSTF
jgi:peptidoglycan hydrolase-like protein with peptidoglycan-binding domain